MLWIVQLLLPALLQTFIDVCLRGAAHIANNILQIIFNLFDGESDLIHSIMSTPSSVGTAITSENIYNNGNLTNFVFGIAIAVLILEILESVFKNMASTVNGTESESVLNVLGRAVLGMFFVVILYGGWRVMPLKASVLGVIGKVFNIIGAQMTPLIQSSTASAVQDIDINISFGDMYEYVGLVIISWGILSGVVAGAISIVERAITIFAYILVGPICGAFYAGKDTQRLLGDWLKGYIVQFIILLFSMLIWGMAVSQLADFMSVSWVNTDLAGRTANGIIALVLFSIVGNTEEIFRSLGFQTMSSMDSARHIMGGLVAAASTFGKVNSYVSGVGSEWLKHDPLGQKFANSRAGQFLGLSKPQDDIEGSLESSSSGNNAVSGRTRSAPSTAPAYTAGMPQTEQEMEQQAFNAEQLARDTHSASNAELAVMQADFRNQQAVERNTRNGVPVSILSKSSPNVGAKAMSMSADYDNYGGHTSAEMAKKHEAIAGAFANSGTGFNATAIGADGSRQSVFVGQTADEGWAMTSGGADVSNIKQITAPDGKMIDVSGHSYGTSEFPTADESEYIDKMNDAGFENGSSMMFKLDSATAGQLSGHLKPYEPPKDSSANKKTHNSKKANNSKNTKGK